MNKSLNKGLSLLLFVIVLIVCSVHCLDEKRYIGTSAKTDNAHTVIVDAGHGGLTNTVN